MPTAHAGRPPGGTTTTAQSGQKALFSNRNFLVLFTSDTISAFGDRVSIFALFILLFNMTGKALDMGLLMIVQAIPAIIVGPVAGVYV
ncbi:MAG: hypothetical protein HY770_03310, partial [Chitinivibrionia bacterium]|nr:hypothetical protein [Chitinivibrionia bacterium]